MHAPQHPADMFALWLLAALVPLALFCLMMWLRTSPGWRRVLATLGRRFRALPPAGKLSAVVFLAVFIAIGSTKPPGRGTAPPAQQPEGGGQAPPPAMAPIEEPAPPRLSTNQYLAGFALVAVATNTATWASAPTNAAVYPRWQRYGVAEDTFWIPACAAVPGDAAGGPATNWSFTIGTNQVDGLYVSSSGTLSFDRPKGSPIARQMPDPYGLSFLAPLQTHLGIVPPAGRFWHAVTASNTLLCTWQDVYFSRLSEYPVSFQVELWPHGDFTYRYNLASLPDQKLFTDYWPLATNFVVGAQHNHGGETFAIGDTDAVVHGLELRWRAFGVLDPGIADHDGDGLSTYDEVMLYGTDPSRVDTDGDGLGDRDEVLLGTDTNNPDSDGDGIADSLDPTPLVPNDPDADADGDGYPLWQELLYGTSDAMYGDVASLLTNGSHTVTFTITNNTPSAVFFLNGKALLLAGRAELSLALPTGRAIPLGLTNAPGASITAASTGSLVINNSTGGFAASGTGDGQAMLILPTVSVGTDGKLCLHEIDQPIIATVSYGLPGCYSWIWNGGGLTEGDFSILQDGIPPGEVDVLFLPEGGNGVPCMGSVNLTLCRRVFCDHHLPAARCGICSDLDGAGGGQTWCTEHKEWKCLCPCLTLSGGGMLKLNAATPGTIGSQDDTCHNHSHYNECCNCLEHQGWSFVEEKTNIVRHISNLLEVRRNGVKINSGQKLIGAVNIEVVAVNLSQTFDDAAIIASPELHPANTVTAAWTVAALGLEPEKVIGSQILVRGDVGCATRLHVITDSELTEGTLRLAAAGALRLGREAGAPHAAGLTAVIDGPPGAVDAGRDFWLSLPAGAADATLAYELYDAAHNLRLATNLQVSAVAARFATNAYYAAFGDTNGVIIGLSPASRDPAGFTLRLDGALCATGQPPWRVASSNLAAGVYTLEIHANSFPDLGDEAFLYVCALSFSPVLETPVGEEYVYSGVQSGVNWIAALPPPPSCPPNRCKLTITPMQAAGAISMSVRHPDGTAAVIPAPGGAGMPSFIYGELDRLIYFVDGPGGGPEAALTADGLAVGNVRHGDRVTFTHDASQAGVDVAIVKNFTWNDVVRNNGQLPAFAPEFDGLDITVKNAITGLFSFVLDPATNRAQRQWIGRDAYPDSGLVGFTHTNFQATYPGLATRDIPSARSVGMYPWDWSHFHLALATNSISTNIVSQLSVLDEAFKSLSDHQKAAPKPIQACTLIPSVNLLNAVVENLEPSFLLCHTYEDYLGNSDSYCFGNRVISDDPIRCPRVQILPSLKYELTFFPYDDDTPKAWDNGTELEPMNLKQFTLFVNKHGNIVLTSSGNPFAWNSFMIEDAIE